jgi:uncharacterized membrane protein YkvA (DUF1232 family)
MKRKFWIIVAALSVIYIFIPEPTDVIPIVGWLDEASAFAILTYALKQLDIPILNKVFGKKSVKTKL